MEAAKGGYSGPEKEESNYAYKIAPIAAVFEDCLQYFEQTCNIMESNPDAWELKFALIDGCFSRFREWGHATKAPSRSLDYALRKSSRLQETTRSLLDDLHGTLRTIRESLQEATLPPVTPAGPQALDPSVDYFPVQSSDGERHVSSRASSDSGSSIQQLTEDLDETVKCLVQLIPALQDPAPQDVYDGRATHLEANKDIELAIKMFPKAPSSLTRRLGFSNWKRRQYFESLDSRPHPARHSDSKTKGIISANDYDHVHDIGFYTTSNIINRPNRIGYSQHELSSSPGALSAGPMSVNDSVFSEQDYFGSRSATSVAESDHLTGQRRYDVPRPPVLLRPGSSFDCPFCGQEIIFGVQIASMADWDRHVLRDLEPYQCTFDGCLRADKTFGIMEDWFRHEVENHRLATVWVCDSCNYEVNEREDIELHLSEKHKEIVTSENLSAMVLLSERHSGAAVSYQCCPFCGLSKLSSEVLKTHVADHLEQLALLSVQTDSESQSFYPLQFGNTAAESKVKFTLLKEFVQEQRGYFWQTSKEQANNSTADSAVQFAEDSDDEAVGQDIKFQRVQPEINSRSQRPPLQRRGDSWMTKVNTFLEKQDAEHPRPDFWKSKVESFLEMQSTQGEPQAETTAFARIGETADYPDQDAALLLPILSGPMRPFRTKPPPRNVDFVGREGDLARIHKMLQIPGSICILSGTGGVGKTSAAVEYTYRYEDSYSYIFWISAETAISCADTYSLIATQFNLAENDTMPDQDRLVTLSREFLEQTEKRWLLIFDNVYRWSDVQEYLPLDPCNTHGSVLITARNSELITSVECQTMELAALSLDEGRQMLLMSMQPSLDLGHLRSHPEYKLAGEIASLAEKLPLALAHIAGYIQVSGCTLTDFVQLWNERRGSTRSSTHVANPLMLSTDKALETVWNIGLREVTTDARELLNILAFLDSEMIQRKLLVGEHKEPSLDFLHSDQAFRYKRMIVELNRRRLITVQNQDDEEILSIHRSLQQKILQDLGKDPQRREDVFAQAFALIRKRFPLPSPIQVPEPEKWPACKEYLPHVLHLQKVVMEYLPSIKPSVALTRLLSDGGINLWERGMTTEGLRLLRSAEVQLDKLACGEDQLRANIHVIIALLVQDDGLGHIAESRDRISKALQIRKTYKDQTPAGNYTREDDILLHNAWSDYGCVLLQYDKYEEAEVIFRQCLSKYHEWGSEEELPYEYYKFNHHTAHCRMYHHDFAEAIRLAEEGLRCITLATGQSSATNKTKYDLACIVLQSGDTQRALDLHKSVLEANLRQHGKFNFLTLQSYYTVGALCAYSGSLVDAERWMRKALTLSQSRPGSWPEAAVARTEFHLSQVLHEQGKDLEEAEALDTRAKATLARLLPLVDPLGEVDAGDELALFDHLQPVFDGRFTGRALL
ncbi:hypothetical protein MMC11_009000, partial [Xylographa trunciseda]|nr:hypothetical protein [Xylographa trunciseda]